MDVDLEKYLDKYPTLSISLIKKIKSWIKNENDFDLQLQSLHKYREAILNYGRGGIDAGPLVHVLSVKVKPNDEKHSPLSIYGKIYAEYRHSVYGHTVRHDLYLQDDPEILGASGNLRLTGPAFSCDPDEAYIPLSRSVICAQLYDSNQNVVANRRFSLDDSGTEQGYEQVKFLVIPCDQVSIVVDYIAIPLGVFGRINVSIYTREERDSINVNGRISARYANTYGNYDSEECVLFDKEATEFERVQIYPVKHMNLSISRCWVGLPAYSSLVLDLDLSEYETGRKIIIDSAHLPAQAGWASGDTVSLDDILITVDVAWFSPTLLYPCKADGTFRHEKLEVDEAEMDTKGADEPEVDDADMDTKSFDEESSDEEEPDDESSSVPWALHSHKKIVRPFSAVEIFSVLIGKKSEAAMQIYGCIEVLSRGRICCALNRDEKNAISLSENVNSVPIPDGSRDYEEGSPFEMKFDLKELNYSLAIKGFVKWGPKTIESDIFLENQLCTVIQGPNGFAAIHYSVFSEAVQANIKVLVNFKNEEFGGSKVYGSLIAEYDNFDYSTSYNREYYRIELFKRNEDNAIQPSVDGMIPLSRSLVVVPIYSYLVVNVDISSGVSGRSVSFAKKIDVGQGLKTVETDDCIIRIELEWCEIK